MLSLRGDPAPHPFVNSPAFESDPAFSPDGRFIAYISNESGEFQLYVQNYPGPGGKWQVSNGDARRPRWSKDGKKLFYDSELNKIMTVDVTITGAGFRAGVPHQVFETAGFEGSFDVAGDGRLLFGRTQAAAAPRPTLRVIENFDAEIGRLSASPQH